jgi:hypothetical protein
MLMITNSNKNVTQTIMLNAGISNAISEKRGLEIYDNDQDKDNVKVNENDIHLADALFVNAIQVRLCLSLCVNTCHVS